MRTLVLTDFHHLTIDERPDPRVVEPDDVVIALAYTGICGTDLHGYTGENGRRVPGQVMGHEAVGQILDAGPAATAAGLAIGQAVTFNPALSCGECPACARGAEQHCVSGKVIGVAPEIVSAYAEQIVVPAGNVLPLPQGVPLAHGALAEPLAVGVQAVRQGGVAAGTTVLVTGGGPIGQAVVLAALRAGAERVVVSEPVAGRRQLCGQLGATTIDPAEGPASERVLEILDGPAHVAVDAVGVDATLADSLHSVGPQGTVVLVGMGTPKVSIPAFAISTGQRHLVGSFCYSREVFAHAVDLLGQEGMDAGMLISREVPLAQAPEIFAEMADGKMDPGKVLLRMDRGAV